MSEDDRGRATPHRHDDRSYEWVGDWSRRRARLTPDRVAVEDAAAGAAYTYADLEARANRTARALGDLGVGPGDPVAVVSRNRVELFDLFFATAKTGSLLAPLSHRLPERELASVLGDADPALVVVETPFEAELIDAIDRSDVDPTVRSLPVDADHRYAPLAARERDDAPVDAVESALDDTHLLLHTGGSTGVPKATELTHGGVYWNSFSTITSWGIREDDVAPLCFPLYHTGGWNVLTLPLLHVGGTVLLRPEVEPGGVLADVERASATVLVAVPSDLGAMARHDDWAGTDLSSLRFVKSGGGPCREAVVEAWRDRGVAFSQGYGLTECGPNNFAMPEDAPPEQTASVGVPAFNVDVRVVDEAGEPLGVDEGGELELAGPRAAAGYRNDPEATARTFGDWVSTGDLAVVDADGYVHVEGRKKNMFVSDGRNVYPPKVEDAVADHPKVEAAVVVGVPDERLGAVGAAVVEGDPSLTLPELSWFLEGRVADYAVPRSLEVVEELPRSGVGKVDRETVAERYGGSVTHD
jgi:fatty-acyl-CoA synthase